ncbi:hypothetical protein HK405_004318, partial [Cladochytrium tenue]
MSTLTHILDGDVAAFLAARGAADTPMRDRPPDSDDEDSGDEADGDWQKVTAGEAVPVDDDDREDICVDCEDQPAVLFCDACGDVYCQVCFDSVHRKGSRRLHTVRPLGEAAAAAPAAAAAVGADPTEAVAGDSSAEDKGVDAEAGQQDSVLTMPGAFPVSESRADGAASGLLGTELAAAVVGGDADGAAVGEWFVERAKYIPVRLTLNERKYLRLLEAALSVTEYTDKIDVQTFSSRARRQVAQIQELCSVISGLVLSADYKAGQELFKDKNFEENAEFFQNIFELGRRHKIMNPEKMRSTYGKLVYILQDSQLPEVRELLQFSCVTEIRTVYRSLEEAGCLDLLRDPLVVPATREILPDGKTRRQIQTEIKQKERAIEILAGKFSRKDFIPENVKQCLY